MMKIPLKGDPKQNDSTTLKLREKVWTKDQYGSDTWTKR